MQNYYLDIKSLENGSFPVHKEDCPFLPEHDKRVLLGRFSSGCDAVKTAKISHLKSDGCYFCLKMYSIDDKINLDKWRVPADLKFEYSEN